MARNGSGVYSLPAGSVVSDGSTVEATQHNTPIQDLETDMNTPRPIVAGGTGASTASLARTALGLEIGSDVQAYDPGLASIASLTTAANKMIYTTGSDTYAVADLTAAGRALLDDSNAATQRATLGLSSSDDVSFSTLGVGTSSPDGTAHIVSGSAGAVTASGNGDDLVVEHSTSAGISILTPATSNGSLYFGDPSSNVSGAIVYSHSLDAMRFYTNGGTEALQIESAGHVRPASDNLKTCGTASNRWSVIYAGTGTINTSDERAKEQIADLSDAEKRVALAAKGILKKFKFNDAVAAKGDDARWHFGVIAQELKAAFEGEGLDPFAYGVLCWDEWWEADVKVEEGTERRTFSTLEEAPEGAERFDRYGVRYEELFAFVLAAM